MCLSTERGGWRGEGRAGVAFAAGRVAPEGRASESGRRHTSVAHCVRAGAQYGSAPSTVLAAVYLGADLDAISGVSSAHPGPWEANELAAVEQADALEALDLRPDC